MFVPIPIYDMFKQTMEKTCIATINVPLTCGCGFAFLNDAENRLTCSNPQCRYYGKKFKSPTITLEQEQDNG